MMKSSLSVRVTAGVQIVVAAVLIGGGFLVVSVTEQRDRRDAGGELRRIAGNLTPWVAGTLGIGRAPELTRLGRAVATARCARAAGRAATGTERRAATGTERRVATGTERRVATAARHIARAPP